MFQFINFHAFAGPGALNYAPGQVDNITSTKISNAIFDHFNVSKNTDIPFSTDIPTEWDFDTIMNADFAGDLNAGNITAAIEQVNSIKVKRRVKGEFDWITLYDVPLEETDNLNFIRIDRFNANGIEYEYALVPSMEGVEGDYYIESILSKFNGVFIGDAETTYRFLFDVEYGTNAVNQQIGVFTPLGKRFPIVVANGQSAYESGSVTATILNDDYLETRVIDSAAIVQQFKALKTFLTNKEAKVLKDWAGNIWLVAITGSPQNSYKPGSGMQIPQLNFSWTQIGEANNQQDLYNAGLIEEAD